MDLRDEIDESVEVVGRRTRGRVASSAMVSPPTLWWHPLLGALPDRLVDLSYLLFPGRE